MEKNENNTDDVLWVSHSKMEIARKCMRTFKYKYIDKLKLVQDDPRSSDFGSCMHEIAENYKGTGKEELLSLYHSMVPSKYIISEDYRPKIPLALKNIHTYYSKCLKHQVEYQNELDLNVSLDETIHITGKIDVLIKKRDGTWRVVDYKTKKTHKFFSPTEQLAMYMILLNKKYNIPYKDIDCEMVFLSMDPVDKHGNEILNEGYDNISKIYRVTEEDVELLKREIKVLKKRIKKNRESGEWPANPSWFNCKYCEYKGICSDRDLSVVITEPSDS